MTCEIKPKEQFLKAPSKFYSEGKYSKIKDLELKLVTHRVVSDDNFATICYVGPLPNSTGLWLGVDWDDESRGRHNGSFNGFKYFETNSVKSGSFVRPTKVFLGLTLEEAITKRYGCADDPANNFILEEFFLESSDSDDECGSNTNPFIKQNVVQGHQKVKVHISGPANYSLNATQNQIGRLKSVVLQSLPVARAMNLVEGGGNLGSMYPLVEELDCARTLFSDWWEVAKICDQWPLLRTLNVSENKLLPLYPCQIDDRGHDSLERSLLYEHSFSGLTTLILVRLFYQWSVFLSLFDHTNNLEHLCLAHNHLSDLEPCLHHNFVNLHFLDLACNEISNFEKCILPLGTLEHLHSLLLNDNHIVNMTLPGPYNDDSHLFPQLNLLAISNNRISSWHPLNHIARIPSLRELIFMFNPILEQQKNIESARQDVIAKLPRVKILNRNEIKYDERKGAEIDYLKRYGKKWLEVLSATGDSDEVKEVKIEGLDEFMREHPRFMTLVDMYGPPEKSEMKEVSRKLKEGLLEVTIEYWMMGKQGDMRTLKKKVPSHMTVQHLRVLLRRLCKIPSSTEFSLCYVSSARPSLKIPLEADTREIGFYNIQNGDRVVVHPITVTVH